MWNKAFPGLPFALRGTEWVSIRQVKRGLACNCHCPYCGTPLMAKKGDKQRHHFAHYHKPWCEQGGETMLHQLAKHLIIEHRRLAVPAVAVYPDRQWRPARLLHFQQATAEYDFGPFRTDVWLADGQQRLAVELSVSHPCPAPKVYYYVRQGIPAVEIDVHALYKKLLILGQGDSLKAFRDALLTDQQHRQWLFNRQQHTVEYRERKQSTRRQVHHSQQGSYHHYHVYRCPRRLRFVRGGFRDGQAYARVFQDCLHCNQCRGIEYDKQWVGFKQLPQKPVEVYCWDRDKQC